MAWCCWIFFKKKIKWYICRDISLRITAIRETFEELGILICRNKEQLNEPSLFSYLLQNFDVEHWQKKVIITYIFLINV